MVLQLNRPTASPPDGAADDPLRCGDAAADGAEQGRISVRRRAAAAGLRRSRSGLYTVSTGKACKTRHQALPRLGNSCRETDGNKLGADLDLQDEEVSGTQAKLGSTVSDPGKVRCRVETGRAAGSHFCVLKSTRREGLPVPIFAY